METIHVVRQGECLSSIAYHYNVANWRVIYDHPANAAFKAKRPNPNLIYPGDELYIPAAEYRDVPCETDKRHAFLVKVPPTYINIRIQDLSKEPIRDARYQLTLDAAELTGKSDDQGWIRGRIPAYAEEGYLKIWPNAEDTETFIGWKVKLGHLDPLETTSGIKSRLNNLGYHCGEVNDLQDEPYDAAVRQFQQDNGLVVDGIVGPKTRGKLSEEHRV
jgi:N-acetylmuramoyl-L-alanine amidase